jgi:hypothetical protein
MQIRLKIALAAAGFALATIPAFAGEMPTDGSKNFSTPSAAPSYFTNEAVPETARVNRAAVFDSSDQGVAATQSAVVPESSAAAEPERNSQPASAHRSGRHASSKSKHHGGATQHAKTVSSKSTRTAAARGSGKHAASANRSASAAKTGGKGGSSSGASKTGTKHAKSGARQHVWAMPSGWSDPASKTAG